MKMYRFALPAMAFLLMISPAFMQSHAAPLAGVQDRGWDGPPREYNDLQRRAFHDGMEGARRDHDNNRRPDPNNRDEYRSPRVDYQSRHAYRDAFRRGYEMAAARIWGGRPEVQAPMQAPPPPSGQWEWGMRGLRSDAERRGFHEGAEHARSDVAERRRADPDGHQEYRYPPVPPEMAEEYRQGFMRGYEVAFSQLSGERSWEGRDLGNAVPERFTETQRQGFHDGMQGAHRDADNHRPPNPANRDEYRDPHVPREMWGEYREGFRRGYEMAVTQMYGQQ